MRATLLGLLAASGDECPVCHAANQSEQAMPLERECEVREYEALQRGWDDGGRSLIRAVEEYRAAAWHRGRDSVRVLERHPGFHEHRERRVDGCKRLSLGERVSHGGRVTGSGQELSDSLEERFVGANQ